MLHINRLSPQVSRITSVRNQYGRYEYRELFLRRFSIFKFTVMWDVEESSPSFSMYLFLLYRRCKYVLRIKAHPESISRDTSVKESL